LRYCIVFIISIFLAEKCNGQKLSKPQAEKAMWEYLKTYNPSTFKMMKNLNGRPASFQIGATHIKIPNDTPPVSWVDEMTDDGVRNSLNTIVHETVHAYTHSWAYVLLQKEDSTKYKFRDNYSAFYLSEDEIYLVRHSAVFSSNKISKTIPKSLHTFRYKPYIAPKNNQLGSQVQGIFGLMDEWNAYYHGTKTAYDLYSYYTVQADDDPQVYLEHITDIAGTYFAHYEFKYYILSYMIYAKDNHPSIYDDILANMELKKAYKAIDQRYTALNNAFQMRLDHLDKILNAKRDMPEVGLKNGYYFIGRKGVGLFSEERDILKYELEKPSFTEMDAILKSGL